MSQNSAELVYSLKRIAQSIVRLVASLGGTVSLVVLGVVITKVFDAWFDAKIKIDDFHRLLLLMSIVVLGGLMHFSYLHGNITKKIDAMARTGSLHFEYVENPSSETSGFRGISFQEFKAHVEAAEESIFSMASSYTTDVLETSNHYTRREFLEAIEKVAVSRPPGTFKYTRVQQIPKDVKDLRAHLGEVTANHCERIIRMGRPGVAVMRIPQSDMSGFLLIDDKTLIVQINGVSRTGKRHTIGVVTVTDNLGKQIQPLVRYCEMLMQTSDRIEYSELKAKA